MLKVIMDLNQERITKKNKKLSRKIIKYHSYFCIVAFELKRIKSSLNICYFLIPSSLQILLL